MDEESEIQEEKLPSWYMQRQNLNDGLCEPRTQN
jgi:hypothetical protein